MGPFIRFKEYKNETVLVVQAHTDDADFYCGATAARLAEAGANVVYLVCTRGEKGTLDPTLTPDELTARRREEQRRANEILGVAETIHFDYPDGELRPTYELQGKISEIIRSRRPALILTFDPAWPEYRMHPDHRASAIAALRANVFSPLPNYFPEQIAAGLPPIRCEEVMVFDPYRRADAFVPVGKYFRRKMDAMLAHESQIAHLLNDDRKKLIETLKKIPSDLVKQAAIGTIAPQFIVERFRRVRSDDILH